MKLKDLAIGERFTMNHSSLVWIKRTNQGMDDNYSSIESVKKFTTRNRNKSTKCKLVKNDIDFSVIN